MPEKTAAEIMKEFKGIIYLDIFHNDQPCVIEDWNILGKTIKVRYSDGRLESCNDYDLPFHMKAIGNLTNFIRNCSYQDMNEKEKQLFKEKLDGLAKLVKPAGYT